MAFRIVNFVIGTQNGQRASTARCSASGLCALTLSLACGSSVVDAGALPEGTDGNGISESPDAGSNITPGTPDEADPTGLGCTIADLGRYRLVFDSDSGRLERRIYSMRADGTELEALTPIGELAREPALSPDGSQLAYVTPEGIRLLTLATGESELLMPGGDQPSWSADGLRLFHRVCSSSYGCGINAIALADRSIEYFAGDQVASSPEVSPDGSTLVYAFNARPDYAGIEVVAGVQAVNTDLSLGIVWRPVESSPLHVSHPTISPDNIWLGAAIQCQNEPSPSLWVSPLAVPTPPCEGHRVTPAGAASVSNPKWGPGALIAYERGTPPRDLTIVAADTGEECIIPRAGDDRNPSWAAPADFQPPQ